MNARHGRNTTPQHSPLIQPGQSHRSRRWAAPVVAALILGSTLPTVVPAAPANAGPAATVMVRTQRMSDATLNSQQSGWYNKGDRLALVCSKRGQSVKGFFSPHIPNGGWDNLWYKVSDGHFVADVDLETGSLNPIAPDCGTPPAPTPAPAAQPGRTMGQTKNVNTGAFGNCTWGAYDKWFQATGRRYYPALGGNAKAWADSASRTGWTVVRDAQPRSIVVFQPGVHGADRNNGHVAWVDSVSRRADGVYVTVTEMNGAAGFNRWSTRTVKDVVGMSYILQP